MAEHTNIKEIIETFNIIDDWEEKYALIIDLGKELPPMDPADRTGKNLVKGCVSQVWFITEQKDGKFYFKADSDSHIVKGLIAIIMSIADGKTKEDIKNIDFSSIFSKLDLEQNLSPNRRNGFYSMVTHIKNL